MMCVSGYLHYGKEGERVGTEEKIILAALRQFEIKGFIAATTKAIAADAGVAEVTLFRIFGDKKSLFVKVAGYIAEKFGIKSIPNGNTGDFRKDVFRLCQNLLGHFIRYNALFRMLIFEAKKYEDIRLVLQDVRGRALANIQALVAGYQDPGGGGRLADITEWLGNSLMGASLCYCLFHEAEDRDAYIRTQSELIAGACIDRITAERK